MRSSAIFAASVAVLVNTIVADDYTGDGNVDLTVGSDGPVMIGDQTPWSVLDTLNQHCSGKTCNTEPWTIPCSLTNSAAGTNSPNNINEGTITVTVVDASISRDNDLAAMVETLKNLASQPQIHSVRTEHYCGGDDGTSPVAPGRFRRRDVTCDREENPSIDQYGTAATFYMRINGDDGAILSFLRIKLEAGVNDDELSKTLCSDLATVGGAVAGAMSGGAGLAAGISLGSLACGAL